MKKDLLIYEKKFELTMSNKDIFILNENEMTRFKDAVEGKGVFQKEDGTLINPAFFLIAKPFSEIEGITEKESKVLNDKERQTGRGKATNETRLKWLKVYREGGIGALYG